MKSLQKIDGETLREWAEWLGKRGCGCCYRKVGDTELHEVDVCVGWHDYCDGPKEEGYANWKICWKIGWQTFDNGMQCDFDVDFDMPWDGTYGVYDTLSEVGAPRTAKEWKRLADEVNKAARKAFAFAKKADGELVRAKSASQANTARKAPYGKGAAARGRKKAGAGKARRKRRNPLGKDRAGLRREH